MGATAEVGMKRAVRWLVRATVGATAIMFLIPFLSLAWHRVIPRGLLPFSTITLVEWVFPVIAILVVASILGWVENLAGWLLALLAACPAVMIDVQVSEWSGPALAKGSALLLLASVAGFAGGQLSRRHQVR
jgi:hypothetical protein